MQRYLDYFIPEALRAETDTYTRARLVVLFSAIFVVCTPVYTSFYAWIGFEPAAKFIVPVLGSLIAAVPLLLRWTGSLALAGNAVALLMYVCISGLVITDGGTYSSLNAWLITSPLLAAMLAGRRSAVVWTLLVAGEVTVHFILQQQGGTAYPTSYPAEHALVNHFFSYLGIVLVAFVMAMMFEWAKKTAFRSLQEARREAERTTEAAREMAAALEEEKRSVERRVEAAVRVSEAQKAYLTRHVDTLLQVMDRFADGDLTVRLDGHRTDAEADGDASDSIRKLYGGFNRAAENLHGMLQQVGAAVENTTSAATEISAATEQLASSTQEQSAQAAEVAAAVEQMTHTVTENAHSATRTVDIAEANGEEARQGGEVVRETVEKIRQIARVVTESAGTVEQLGHSSRQIGTVVETIDGIAEQTNLLALNAAIEAARAGDQGRGFAVVADEVRQLAERTTAATKEIAEMIKTIQHETEAAVAAMQRGNDEVAEGIDLADQAGEALRRIVEGAASTVDSVTQIAAASEQQSATSEQIARSVETISVVTQESAHGIGTINTSADRLDALSAELRTLVARFTLEEAVPRAAGGDGHAGTYRPA